MTLALAVREALHEAQLSQAARRGHVLPRAPTLEQIRALQRGIEENSIPGVMPIPEIPAEHFFADGLYARKLARPAGTLVVGKMHAKQHFYVLLEGEIIAWTEQGMKRLKAPTVLTTEPGTKRVTYAITDAVSMTFHATRETDLGKLEDELIIPDMPELAADAMARLELEKPT